jgi:hypothetical protein
VPHRIAYTVIICAVLIAAGLFALTVIHTRQHHTLPCKPAGLGSAQSHSCRLNIKTR